jgi:hypothetical protein
MYTWRSGIIVGALLSAGCGGGDIEAAYQPPGGSGAGSAASGGSGGSGSPAAGNTGKGVSGSAGANPGSGGSGPGSGGTTGGGGEGGVVSCVPGIPTTSQMARLTNAQYDRTIRDLVGLTNLTAADGVAPSTRLATDQAGSISALAWANYKDVADKIATQVIADATLKSKFLKCTPVAGDTTCFDSTISEFGRRAFRRPLTTDEITRFQAVVSAGSTITPTGSPDEIAQVLLYMFLISPSFLSRAEIVEMADGAGHFTLSPHEIASRLSYMLWGTMPDPELDAAADAGQLSTPAQIAAQADRMLKDDKAREMVQSFNKYYLLMRAEGRWDTAQRDPGLFPNFKPEMVPALSAETLKLFEKVTFTPGASFKDFLLTNVAYVNRDTAPLYGLNAADFGADLTETTLDATRPGFLTRLGFLINFSSFTRTNPIYRGAFITKQILGIQLGAPPPGATETPLPSGADLDTNRKQVDAQTSAPSCVGCHHTFINPPGFVMEAFDAVGMARTSESNGVALDTVADVTIEDGQDPVTISSPAELMAKIAASPGAMRQYASKWVSFAYAREGHPADACVADQLAQKMASGAYPVLNIITDLTQAESFRVRAVEVTQ